MQKARDFGESLEVVYCVESRITHKETIKLFLNFLADFVEESDFRLSYIHADRIWLGWRDIIARICIYSCIGWKELLCRLYLQTRPLLLGGFHVF